MERIVSIELVVIAGILWFGYIGGILAKRFKLPEVAGFIILGIILGPRLLNIITPDLLNRLDFVNPLALGLITFGIGERLKFSSIREIGFSIFGTTAAEAFGTILLVFVLLFISGTSLPLSILLSIIAAATAPMTVVAVLREMRASGKYTNSLVTMVALDNIVSISLFAAILPLAAWRIIGSSDLTNALFNSFVAVGGAVLTGFIVGLLLSFLVSRIETSSELLLFVIAHVLLCIALAELFGFSLLLTTLVLGMVTVNLSAHADERERIFAAINVMESMVFVIFFIIAGASMHIELLPKVGIVTLLYIIGRSIGKIGGTFSGAYLSRESIFGQSWLLGFGLVPQAGAAIGLAISARESLGFIGEEILTIILAAVAFFELIGPLTVRYSLTKVGEAGLAINEIDRSSHLAKRTFTKILVPTAGPAPAKKMIDTIKEFALKLEADVLAIYIQRTKSEQDKKTGEESLKLFRKLEEEGVKIQTEILFAEDIPEKIVEVAKQEEVDLIIMGTSRASWIKKRIVGNINQRILLKAPCPVLEVPFEKSKS